MIRRRRQDLDLSQQALGALCGLSGNAISNIEQGKTDPRLSSLTALVSALGGTLNPTPEWSPVPDATGEQTDHEVRGLIQSTPTMVSS